MNQNQTSSRIVTGVAAAIALSLACLGASNGAKASDDARLGSAREKATRSTASDPAIPLALSLAPATVVGGNPTTATITLSAAAPAGGIEITLTSLNPEVARFGGRFAAIGTSQLRIREGSVSATFPVRTSGVAGNTQVNLQAFAKGDVASATLTVIPASVKTLVITPPKVVGGASSKGTITLDGLTPATAGVEVQIAIDSAAASRTLGRNTLAGSPPASTPASVTVAAGTSSVTFAISTSTVSADTSVTIRAGRFLGGSTGATRPAITDGSSNTISFGEGPAPVATASLAVLAPVPAKLLLSPGSVPGGAPSKGTVVLTGKAPSGGVVFGLLATSRDASVPTSITIPAGTDRESFTISTQPATGPRIVTISVRSRESTRIADGTSNTIIVGESGELAISADLSITATPPLLAISAQPTSVPGGATVAITVTLQPIALGGQIFGGPISVALTSDHPLLLNLPATTSILAPGQGSIDPQTVIVNATTVPTDADQNVTITASAIRTTASATLLIKQTPPPIESFTLRPTTVTGGVNIIAQIGLSSTAPNQVTVNFTTDHPELVTVPASVNLARTAFRSPITFRTTPVSTSTTVTITASTGTQSISATVSIVP